VPARLASGHDAELHPTDISEDAMTVGVLTRDRDRDYERA
jgi:hypothetical protein